MKTKKKRNQKPEAKTVNVGDATLHLLVDTSQVDEFIARIEKALAAFKTAWVKR